MVPPAGTSSMLRSRRRDATLKPNRTLDRSASRGMLYENEELRLRTININAEVEKGQNYIKKLRRENEQLKREIWNLREEYERLENYVKSREQSENEEVMINQDDDNNDNNDDNEILISGEPTEVATETTAVASLETVVEEDDDNGDQLQINLGPSEFIAGDVKNVEPLNSNSPGVDNLHEINIINNDRRHVTVSGALAADHERDTVTNTACTMTATADGQEGRATAVTTDTPATGGGVGCDSDDPDRHDDGDRARQPQPQQEDPVLRGGQPLSQLDAAVLQPHTACFDTGSNRQLHDLTVDEVIDAIQDAELRDKLRTVCLTDDRCYMTFANAECLERALHTALSVRDIPVLLMDTGAGAVILSLTGVPDTVADKDVLKCLKKYGTIIGGVERKTARCGTAGGERYVRVRLTLGAPRYLWFGSDKVIVRQLTEHETGTMNSIARRKSFRSQIKLNLKMADSSASSGDHGENGGGADSGGGGDEACCGSADGGGAVIGSSTATAMTAVSVQNGFKFPTSDPKTTAVAGPPVTAEPKTAAVVAGSTNSKSAGSPKKSKPLLVNDRDGAGPPTAASGPSESPLRGRRRTSLMGFRRETIIKHRGGSMSRADGGEDAESDTSTICRRKLSITGHEGTEKVPWCGCWGNGCL
ncbi:PREDICTED: uncharacterized protein LOC107165374 [Diuraphis noxia]|uniref:uncharacterized protein LOC107165374 n=1 Tax=Diuraphis noxia TaxID=143948 RepID=UPI000763B453|nr:PREDICTED: uncharacterized protein LOC107165374 [Diuraphis noxia]